jgi:hypothetical protein
MYTTKLWILEIIFFHFFPIIFHPPKLKKKLFPGFPTNFLRTHAFQIFFIDFFDPLLYQKNFDSYVCFDTFKQFIINKCFI